MAYNLFDVSCVPDVFHLARFIGEIYEVDINYEQKNGVNSRSFVLLKYEKIFTVLADTFTSSNSHMLYIF